MSEKETLSPEELLQMKNTLENPAFAKRVTTILATYLGALSTKVQPNHLEAANMERLGLKPEEITPHSKN